jgi:hypothetical protein
MREAGGGERKLAVPWYAPPSPPGRVGRARVTATSQRQKANLKKNIFLLPPRHTYDGDVEALCKSVGQSVPHGGSAADLLRVYQAATRARVGSLITRQFNNMQEILRYHRVGTIDEFVTVKICGKKAGADPRDANNKDDIVMALCMAIEGAEAFYWRPEFAAERASVGVHTAPLYGLEAGR